MLARRLSSHKITHLTQSMLGTIASSSTSSHLTWALADWSAADAEELHWRSSPVTVRPWMGLMMLARGWGFYP